MIRPLQEQNLILAHQYQDILTNSQGFEIHPLDKEIAIEAAKLRTKYTIKIPDAIQIAVSFLNHCDYFLTNDTQLKAISEISVLTMEDL